MKHLKRIALLVIGVLILSSCTESKTFTTKEGTTFVAKPYGWNNQQEKIDGVTYQVSIPNLVVDIVFAETIIIPIWLTSDQFFEPVSYNQDNK